MGAGLPAASPPACGFGSHPYKSHLRGFFKSHFLRLDGFLFKRAARPSRPEKPIRAVFSMRKNIAPNFEPIQKPRRWLLQVPFFWDKKIET